MNTNSKIVLAVVTGIAIGAVATHGLHAQAKLKAYSIGEIEVIDSSAQPSYLPAVRKAIEEHHGHTLRTLNGRVQHIEGAEAPKEEAIVERESMRDGVKRGGPIGRPHSSQQRGDALRVSRAQLRRNRLCSRPHPCCGAACHLAADEHLTRRRKRWLPIRPTHRRGGTETSLVDFAALHR